MSGIEGLHHNAYRCRDAGETRAFYEDFLGLPLTDAFVIGETMTGRVATVLHMFFEMQDGSSLAFFEAPLQAFSFKKQHDFDLHIALKVTPEKLQEMHARGKAAGIETRGPVDHGFIHSIYFRDPNGYVIELSAPVADAERTAETLGPKARRVLDEWQHNKPASVTVG